MALSDFLFGQSYDEAVNPYKEAYKAAEQNVHDTYASAFDDSNFYNQNKDLFAEVEKEMPGFTDSFLQGTYGKGLQDRMDTAQAAADEAYRQYGAAKRANKYNVVGNGLLGTLLSPVIGVADMTGDLFASGAQSAANLASGITSGDWDKYGNSNRYNEVDSDGHKVNDFAQDVGTLANAALMGSGFGNLGSAASLGSKALVGAGLGAGQSIAADLQNGGEYTDLGSLGSNALFSGLIGGALPIAGNLARNISTRGAVKSVNNALRNAGFGSNLDDAGMYAAGQNVLGDQYQELLSQANSGTRNKLTNFATGALPNSRLGKAAAIGGGAALGGYGLSKMFGGNNTQQIVNDIKLGGEYLSDEELAALYDYYGIGV